MKIASGSVRFQKTNPCFKNPFYPRAKNNY
jgi:hypothetical protein